MNKEERVKLVFETLSKIAGFEIKPDKEFYMIGNGRKDVYRINENLNLYYKTPKGIYVACDYSILPIFRGGYQLEEIKEPLTTEEEREFLRQFKFGELEKISTYLNIYKDGTLVNVINLSTINFSFGGLEDGKKYSGKALGL